MKEREKCKKNEPSLTSMRQMVLEISQPKVRNLSKMEVTILKVFSLIFRKYDVTDAILQKNEKMKVQYLSILLFDLFEIFWALGFSKQISLDFKFSCFGIYNKNNKPLFKNKRLLFSHNQKSVSSILFQKTILRAVIIQLYCFRLFFENTFA